MKKMFRFQVDARSRKLGAEITLLLCVLIPSSNLLWGQNRTIPARKHLVVKADKIIALNTWTYPLWGYNAPKIVEGAGNQFWTVTYSGKYPACTVRLARRDLEGKWEIGDFTAQTYQPAMIFLDHDGRLNLICNSQTSPISQYRSDDAGNLDHFKLVATGNGGDDGRGWYIGVGIRDSIIYMAYITLSYDLYLTWKNVCDSSWHARVLLHKGLITSEGNHSWTRPGFQFYGNHGYILVNETSDGSVKNTYNKVQLIRFRLTDPTRFSTQLVYSVPLGYFAFGYSLRLGPKGQIAVAFASGNHVYGEPSSAPVKQGTYVATKGAFNLAWRVATVDTQEDEIALDYKPDGILYAVMQSHDSDGRPSWLVRNSADLGRYWTTVLNGSVESGEKIASPTHLQLTTASSGSETEKDLNGVFVDDLKPSKTTDSTSDYDLYFFRMVQESHDKHIENSN